MSDTSHSETPTGEVALSVPPADKRPEPIPYLRLGITGIFMGMANLVPGVSGGTMVLALGLYEDFIGAFSDLTRLRFSFRAIVVVAMLFGLAGLTIFGLADGIQFLMETFLPGMLALFIGMTLGGAPMLAKQLRPMKGSAVAFAILGFVIMGLIAFILRPGTTNPGWTLLLFGGIVGSATMILPGISGSYMLLIMGLYLPIIAAISVFKDALKTQDWPMLMDVGVGVILPVGIGLVLGLALLSNLLKFLLNRCHRATVGFLLGLLLGSVLGLYPFKDAQFNKLPRHAVETPDRAKPRQLRLIGAGWTADPDSVIYRNVKALANEGLDVLVLSSDGERGVTSEDVRMAREQGAVIIAYDTETPKEIRREARVEPEVDIEIVANTEFSPLKGVLAVLLIGIGFCITFFLGRMDLSKSA
ncbi:DUF368 domain-containing protein [bacterium]|nr:DUF368 domain-containing protein [bacterium]